MQSQDIGRTNAGRRTVAREARAQERGQPHLPSPRPVSHHFSVSFSLPFDTLPASPCVCFSCVSSRELLYKASVPRMVVSQVRPARSAPTKEAKTPTPNPLLQPQPFPRPSHSRTPPVATLGSLSVCGIATHPQSVLLLGCQSSVPTFALTPLLVPL